VALQTHRANEEMMVQKINRLNARAVAMLTKHGRHADGGGLYLSISHNGGRRWTFLYQWRGKRVEIGFGSARDVSLARARELAAQARGKLAEGINPKEADKPSSAATFAECADRQIAAMRPSWRNAEHARQWEMALGQYAAPLRPLLVDEITTDDVLAVLQPLWQRVPETANRLRARIERVLDAAKAQGLRSGENPARWRGHLDQLLARRKRLEPVHHSAMSYTELPEFLRTLRQQKGVAPRALEFLILTAARTGEVTGARLEEIGDSTWSIPAERMKAGRAHREPLSPRALAIVNELRNDSGFLFRGMRGGLSESTMRELLYRIAPNVTVHGFRSTFRDWAAEQTNFPREVCEQALAHLDGSAVERAYRRSDLFEQRPLLMRMWADYCQHGQSAKIVPLRA
jgi:integrase